MPSGVKIKDIVIGTGEEAMRGKTVVANVRVYLNHGTQLPMDAYSLGPRLRIDLGKRECIAGLRYGIEGMRVGGRRDLVISPHLAYGAKGIAGHVPPNAVLRCQVELLEVREAGARTPEDYPPGKHLFVFHPGEAARNLPRWQFGLDEDGRCGVIVTRPMPGTHWRHAPVSHAEARLDTTAAQRLIEETMRLPQASPNDCLSEDDLWADMAERGNVITREKRNNALCLTLGVSERGQWLAYFSVAEASPPLLESLLLKIIDGLVSTQTAG